MASNKTEKDCWSLRPKILFIKCQKGLSKENVQDCIARSLREVSGNCGKDLTFGDFHVENLTNSNGIRDADIAQVSIGPSYIGVLLKTGQVYRVRCVPKTPRKVKLSSSKQDEMPFLVRSDRSFARQLHDEQNKNRRPSTSVFGHAKHQRFHNMPTASGEADPLESSRRDRGFPNISMFPGRNESTVDGSESVSSVNTQPCGGSVMSESPTVSSGDRYCSSARNRPDSSSESTPSSAADQNYLPCSVDNANERIQRESSNNSDTVLATPQQPTCSSIHQTARRTLALAQILQHQSEMLRNFVGSQQQSGATRAMSFPYSRLQYHSPVIRSTSDYYPTTFGRDPLPSRYTSGTLENRRIAPVFSRRGRSLPTPAFLGQYSVENPVFIQVGGDSSSKKRSSDKQDRKAESKKSKNFDWPVIGDVEWLQTELTEEPKFTKIVAMTSSFLLVTDTGQLFQWPYENALAEEPSPMSADSCRDFGNAAGPGTPKAVPHPLTCALGLDDKRVSQISACGIRASILTSSGHLCTFYDELVRGCRRGRPPSLIEQLSHSATLFSSLVGESIVSLECQEFYSAVLTSAGNCYWWGLPPGGERKDLEEKLSKLKQAVHLSVGEKVKLQKIVRGSSGTLVYKMHESLGPCVAHIVEEGDARSGGMERSRVKVQIVASGADISNLNVSSDDGTSPGPSHESTRVSSSSTVSTRLPPLVDSWELSEIIFLQDDQACFGVVVGVDGPHVIVETGRETPFTKPQLKVFKTSDLQKIPDKAGEHEGTSALEKQQLVNGRFIQESPKSVMDTCRVSCSYPVASAGVTKRTLRSLRYKAISMTCTKEGVVLLVRNPVDDKVYYLGPSCGSLGDCSKQFTCSSEVSSTMGNGQVAVTVIAESVLGRDSALLAIDPTSTSDLPGKVGLKRKLSSSDEEYDGPTVADSLAPLPEAVFPRLVSASSLCGSILLDSNGCFYPRTLNTKLNGFHSLEISPFQCFDIGERTVTFENEDYDVLVVPLVFKRQSLVKAIQTGLETKVQRVLRNMEDLIRLNSGKGGKVKGKKKVAVQQQTLNGPVAVDKETASYVSEIIPEVLNVLSEKVSGNRNILHLCCSNLGIEPEERHFTIDDVLDTYKAGGEKDEDHDIKILKTLLQHPVFGSDIMGKLKERDVNGCTPFLLALRCHNFKAALFILDYLKEKELTGALVDWKTMVYCKTASGETPLHIVAMKSCAGLGLTGLGNSLIVSNLPSNYTPRMLLKLFQSRYPSAYRAAIPPLDDVERVHSSTVWQKRERKMRGPLVAKLWNSNEGSAASKSSLQVPIAASSAVSARYGNRSRDSSGQRREALEGMVTFADHKEMRKALCEMDKHVISNEHGHPDVGLTSVVQHTLHVKLARLNAEGNKEDRSEMEMEYNGVLYGVTSKGLGCSPKINKKNKSHEASEETQKVEEDELVCQLVERLLENPEVAMMTNNEGETALAFLINYCRWIKPTENQKKRFQIYCRSKNSRRNSDSALAKSAKTQDSDPSTSSKLGSVGASTSRVAPSTLPMFPVLEEETPDPWNEIMVEFDELKNNFSNLVKSLESIENVSDSLNSGSESTTSASSSGAFTQGSGQTEVTPPSESGRRSFIQMDIGASKDTDGTSRSELGGVDGLSGNDLIFIRSNTVHPVSKTRPPVLLQLANNWPCFAKTVLGKTINDKTMLGTFDASRQNPIYLENFDNNVSEACDLDFFVQELLSNADELVLDTITNTIIGELNKHSFSFKDYVDENSKGAGWNAARLSLLVGQRFLRSVTRQLCFLLSHNHVALVKLPGARNSRATGSRMNVAETKRRVGRVFSAFSWLSVYEMVEAAEAVVIPFRDGVAKPQRSTGKDYGNVSSSAPVLQNAFPVHYGANRGRPGIRVSGVDNGSLTGTNYLRSAPRVSSERDQPQSHHFLGVRLFDVDESSSSDSKSEGPSKPTSSGLFGVPQGQLSPVSTRDSDSDSEDDSRDCLSDETDLVLDTDDRPESPAVTGITHDHLFAWALDGRLASAAENSNGGRGINFGVPVGSTSPPSVHAGNCYLARVFSRLVKEVIDVIRVVDGHVKKTASKDAIVFKLDDRISLLDYCESILEKSWLWLINVMDTVEGQLQRGKHFDTKRYLVSLQRSGESEMAAMGRSLGNMAGATPEEYLMFLLRSHTNEHSDTLPVMDMLCYEHAVYVLDAFMYVLKGWPKSGRNENSESAVDTYSAGHSDDLKSSIDQASFDCSASSGSIVVDETTRQFFLSSNPEMTVETFVAEMKRNIRQSSRGYVPSVSLEIFDRGNSVVELEERLKLRDPNLPVSYRGTSSCDLKLPVMHHWSVDDVADRWTISIDIFSRLFLAEGPGGERDSFLTARAGTAGRIARFRRALAHLRESLNSDPPQGIFGAYGFSGRVGTVLSLNVRRSHLLEDMLKSLGEMSAFHYTNFRVKFDGEEGSGPGVNRGFFAAVANALKADEEQPSGTASLMYEPGKLPEQSGYFAPRPCCRNTLAKQGPELIKRRHTMFKSIGRFLGLCLWFGNAIPLNLTRTVIKYILGSEIVWQDLAFLNADLFDGLSRMIVDSMDPAMSEEVFQSTYCCHFEVSVAGETVELLENGSYTPVTKHRTLEYARLYAQKVMLDCVAEEFSNIKQGVHEIIPPELLKPLTAEDFQLLISGGTLDIDIIRLKSVTSFVNSNGCSSNVMNRFKKWFWSIVNKMTPLQRQQLLYFATGSAMLPAMPDRKESDQDDISITIDIIRGNPKALPMASTCGQRMSVPLYPSRRILKRKLLQAIQCQTYGLG